MKTLRKTTEHRQHDSEKGDGKTGEGAPKWIHELIYDFIDRAKYTEF